MRSVSSTMQDRIGCAARQVCLAALVGALATVAVAQSPGTDAGPDAVIELWEQHWSMTDDGAAVYHEKKHVRMNNPRVFRDMGDPRITYNEANDKLEILTARTRLPDGRYVELPDYAHVKVSPSESEGWPAFANIRQHLLVMSGLEAGCVTEVEYRITARPGACPHLAADLQLTGPYPIKRRVISVEVPAGGKIHAALSNVEETATGSDTRQQWEFRDLPAAPADPQHKPWELAAPRLVFTTAADVGAGWLRACLGPIEQAAASRSTLIRELADKWTAEARTPAGKLRAIHEHLAKRFNFVEFPVDWWPATPRQAVDVMASHYGLPFEAAAAFLALARAADLDVRPGILSADHAFHHEAPQRSMIAAYVVLLQDGGELQIWDAHHGRLMRDARWAGHTLLWFENGALQHTALPAWTDADESRCVVQGDVEIDEEGHLSGTFTLRATGLFASAEALREAAAQKRRVAALVRRVLPGVEVKDYTVERLAPQVFVVVAEVAGDEVLEPVGDSRALRLADEGPFLVDVPLPLDQPRRETALWVGGAFEEQVELTVKAPAGWSLTAEPARVATTGPWGKVEQTVNMADGKLTLSRQVRVEQRELKPGAAAALINTLNELRSAYARTLIWR